MSFSIMNDDMEIVGKLGDEPNEDDGLDAAGLKAVFDQAGKLCKAAINKLIAELHNAAAAASVGFSRSASVPADNVQDAIENVQQQIAGVSQGAVPNNSITTGKLVDESVTGAKVASGTLLETVAGSTAMHLISTEATSATNKLNLHYIRSLGMVLVDGVVEIVPSAVGQQSAEFGFDSYEPVFDGVDLPSVITPDHQFSIVWIIKQNGTVKLVTFAKGIESAEIGETRTIPVFGWYFCNGEGS